MELDLRGLSFSFGEKQVLRDVSFKVHPGEFLGLMGPNGSGKTTLLRCLMNFLPAGSESISVDGRPLDAFSPAELARTFAVVPQSSATDFSFTAYDIVMMGRIPHVSSRIAGTTKEDASAVRSAMERTDTWKFASRPFYGLSGGERQKVIVARALAQQSKALLLDEPTVYLDINGQFEVMDLIKRLNREEGTTVIAVLHDVNLAARYCSRIALLSHGMLEAIGPPKEVLTPEIIQSVYGVDVVVRRDPFTEAVYVVPHTISSLGHAHGTHAHLLCGGGTGGPIMKALVERGFSVSAGVLNVLDSDYENVQDLHLAVVAEAPFAPISEGAYAENMRFIEDSKVVIVSPFPVGPGNIRNLEAARAALRAGKLVMIVSPAPGKTIDFVGGKADAAVKDLISSGAIPVKDVHELVSKLPMEGTG